MRIGDLAQLSGVSTRTLRLYDELGLLKPERLLENGYREYRVQQITKLEQILALRDLGFTLEQIRELLEAGLSEAKLRQLLALKQAELEAHLGEVQGRLGRVRQHLAALDQERIMQTYPIILKPLPAQLVAGVRDRTLEAPAGEGLSIQRHYDLLREHLQQHGLDLSPGQTNLWHYSSRDDHEPEAEVVQPLKRPIPPGQQVKVYQIPAADQAATLVYRGSYATREMTQAFRALHEWLEGNNYRAAGPTRQVFGAHLDGEAFEIELQVPVAPG